MVVQLKMAKAVLLAGLILVGLGVHCTRAKSPPTARATALASVVFPSPGRSSNSKCPRARRQASTFSTMSFLPIKADCNDRRRPSMAG